MTVRHRPLNLATLLIVVLLGAACAGQVAQTPLPATTEAGDATVEPRATSTRPEPASSPTETTGAGSAAPRATATPVTEPTVAASPTASATPEPVRFAVIGDYGLAGPPEGDVSALVHEWQPDFIVTTGDNNYPNGAAETIDQNIGQYYADFIYPYTGDYEVSSPVEENRFFPSLGNHDYVTDDAQPYLDYFTLPGNERYYEVRRGPVHVFALNSNWAEPDGIRADSEQGTWLRESLAASTAPWKLVTMHVAPYSSAHHGSSPIFQWPFAEWGASAVLAGHDHTYERLSIDGLPYFVNGLGGFPGIYGFEGAVAGSQVRFNEDYGAMRVEATEREITFEFITRTGFVVDTYTLSQ